MNTQSMKRVLQGLLFAGILATGIPATAHPGGHRHTHAVKKKRAKPTRVKTVHRAPVVYRPVVLRGVTVYEREGRYYRRDHHAEGYRYVETYPLGATYTVLPGPHTRVVRRGKVVFLVHGAYFRPVYRDGVTTYVIVD